LHSGKIFYIHFFKTLIPINISCHFMSCHVIICHYISATFFCSCDKIVQFCHCDAVLANVVDFFPEAVASVRDSNAKSSTTISAVGGEEKR
jgi:hypothetical protein